VPSIQEDVQDLDPAKVQNKRTRSCKSAETSQPLPAQPSIPKKKRKHAIRKLKESRYVAEEEDRIVAATDLVTREVKRKKVEEEATLQKANVLAQEIGVSTDHLVKETTVEAAQLGIELTENLQQLVVSGELVDTTEGVQKEVGCSEANASEAAKGNTDSLNTANIIEVGSSNTSVSLLTSTTTS